MKLIAKIIVAAILLAHMPQVKAADYMIQGVGITTCAKYNEFYRQNARLTDDIFGSWASGYLSGLNSAFNYTSHNYRNLGRYPVTSMTKWLHGYCARHPLEMFLTGVIELGAKLPMMQTEEDIPPED